MHGILYALLGEKDKWSPSYSKQLPRIQFLRGNHASILTKKGGNEENFWSWVHAYWTYLHDGLWYESRGHVTDM